MDKYGVFRVNYDKGGQPKSDLIVALTDVEAAAFCGVADVPGVQVTRDRYPVEVVGLHDPHAKVASPPVNKAAFDLPKGVSRDDFNALQAQVADLQSQLSKKGK